MGGIITQLTLAYGTPTGRDEEVKKSKDSRFKAAVAADTIIGGILPLVLGILGALGIMNLSTPVAFTLAGFGGAYLLLMLKDSYNLLRAGGHDCCQSIQKWRESGKEEVEGLAR